MSAMLILQRRLQVGRGSRSTSRQSNGHAEALGYTLMLRRSASRENRYGMKNLNRNRTIKRTAKLTIELRSSTISIIV
jgi:hypothetical protein